MMGFTPPHLRKSPPSHGRFPISNSMGHDLAQVARSAQRSPPAAARTAAAAAGAAAAAAAATPTAIWRLQGRRRGEKEVNRAALGGRALGGDFNLARKQAGERRGEALSGEEGQRR